MMPMIAAAGSSGRSYSKPKAAKPAATAPKAKRQKGGTDHALKAAAAVYRATHAADVALDSLPPEPFGTTENARREREGGRICNRRDGAVRKAARLPAATPAGMIVKAELIEAELAALKWAQLTTESPVCLLAASLAADVRRTGAPLTLAGLLAAEDASADAELIELCAAWPAAVKASNAEDVDDGPAFRAFEALEARIEARKPHTLAGLLALARQAKFEARDRDGNEAPENNGAADTAWRLLNDLLRLTGEGA